MIADMEKAILGVDFLHKYGLLVDINNCCLTDPLTNGNFSGLLRKGFPLSPSVANTEENLKFGKF